jgi:hypothetical protein
MNGHTQAVQASRYRALQERNTALEPLRMCLAALAEHTAMVFARTLAAHLAGGCSPSHTKFFLCWSMAAKYSLASLAVEVPRPARQQRQHGRHAYTLRHLKQQLCMAHSSVVIWPLT